MLTGVDGVETRETLRWLGERTSPYLRWGLRTSQNAPPSTSPFFICITPNRGCDKTRTVISMYTLENGPQRVKRLVPIARLGGLGLRPRGRLLTQGRWLGPATGQTWQGPRLYLPMPGP